MNLLILQIAVVTLAGLVCILTVIASVLTRRINSQDKQIKDVNETITTALSIAIANGVDLSKGSK
jgi:hypothetical protein